MKHRISYIDVYRGIGILLMIMGHIGFGGTFDYFIHSFHMPMFFFVSGYFYNVENSSNISTYMYKKIKALIVPYIIFNIIGYLFRIICLAEKIEIYPLINMFTNNTEGISIGALWFLTALFFTDVIYFILNKYIKKTSLLSCIILMLTFIGVFELDLFSFRLPLSLGPSLVGLGFYHIARLIRENSHNRIIYRILNLKVQEILGIFILNSILIFLNGYINMRTASYSFVPLFWINSVTTIVLLWDFSKIINKFNCKQLEYLKFIGSNSIIYVCLNQLTIETINLLCFNFFEFESLHFINKLIYNSFVLILVVLILSFITKLLKRNKYKKILGLK